MSAVGKRLWGKKRVLSFNAFNTGTTQHTCAGFAALTRFLARDRIPISSMSMSAVKTAMQFPGSRTVAFDGVNCEQKVHLLGGEINLSG